MANTFISPFGYLTGAALMTIYTCPQGKKSLVRGIQCSNNSANDVKATVVWQDLNGQGQGASGNYLMTSGNVPAYDKINLIDQGYLVLNPSDRIDATASESNKIYVLVSAMETDI